MEKFGIFELLDALSALLPADGNAPRSPQEDIWERAAKETDVPEPSATSANQPSAPAPHSVPDAAFAPPDYGTGAPEPQENGENSAFDTLMKRHEQLSRKIGSDK